MLKEVPYIVKREALVIQCTINGVACIFMKMNVYKNGYSHLKDKCKALIFKLLMVRLTVENCILKAQEVLIPISFIQKFLSSVH